jgi:uncharacterized low-complexity protein
MTKKATMKPTTAALGAVFAASLVSLPAANADENPFGMTKLSSGYMVADSHKEGKCGEGEKKTEGKCGEGKMEGGKMQEGEMEEGKKKEGKCGEGKCGGSK